MKLMWDWHVLLGVAVLIVMLALMVRCARNG